MVNGKQYQLSPQSAENTEFDNSRAVSVRDFKILRQRTAEDGAKLQAQITVNADEIALRATKTYVDGQDANLESAITVNAEAITLRATKTYVDGIKANLEASITVNANAIALKASQSDLTDLGTRVTTAESTLTVQADQIATKVSTTDLNTMLTNYSTITQTATQIATRVATTDYNGNEIASRINQSATTIQLDASKINLNGFVTLTNLTDGATTISGANIKTGNISATSVTIGGWSLNSSQIYKGAIKLDSANERIYLNSAAYLYAYTGTTYVGLSGGLIADGTIQGTSVSSNAAPYNTTYGATNIVSKYNALDHPLTLNGSKIITAASFSLSGTTLTITM